MHTPKAQIQCPNCGNFFDPDFKFCPYCGQENKPLDLRLRHLLGEFLSANFNLDSKLLRTLRLLIFHPAKLTQEYLAGKRQKYITPVRLYLLISLFYFLVLSLTPSNFSININTTGKDVEKEVTTSHIGKIIWEKVTILQTPRGKKLFWQKMQNNFSAAMFLFIPLTALVLSLLFPGQRYYAGHLVLTLHLQSLIFIALTLLNIIFLVTKSDWITFVKLLTILVLSFIWLKKFYHLTAAGTLWRMSIAGVLIMIIYGFVASAVSVLSLMSL